MSNGSSHQPNRLWRTLHRVWNILLAAPCTLILSMAAVLAAVWPGAAPALELTRGAIADGEVWRLLTGHLTHFGMNHLAWDLAMFAALGVVCERRWRDRTRLALAVSALAISGAILVFADGIETYRGLSGLDSALFGLVAMSLLRDGETPRGRAFTVGLWTLVAGFAAKVGYEFLTGTTFFVDSTSAGFVPLPLAHAVGFLTGMAIACAAGRKPPAEKGQMVRFGVHHCTIVVRGTCGERAIAKSRGRLNMRADAARYFVEKRGR